MANLNQTSNDSHDDTRNAMIAASRAYHRATRTFGQGSREAIRAWGDSEVARRTHVDSIVRPPREPGRICEHCGNDHRDFGMCGWV